MCSFYGNGTTLRLLENGSGVMSEWERWSFEPLWAAKSVFKVNHLLVYIVIFEERGGIFLAYYMYVHESLYETEPPCKHYSALF